MLTKATHTLRPFLRVPSSSGSDHFTSNPSLLHHLPQNGAGHSLVSQAQSSASTSGSNGTASGRAGHGPGSGGYTGHARAFLSLPLQQSIDPSSAFVSSDDQHQQQLEAALFRKYRLSRPTRLIGPAPDTPSRGIRREIESRSGNKVAVVEVENVKKERRSSIAFPSRQPQPISTAGVFQVGISRPARRFAVRSLSTQAGPMLPKVPTAESRLLAQPNRVMMDLAGIEMAPKRLGGQVRRNSSSAVERPESSRQPWAGKLSNEKAGEEEDLRDRNIYHAIQGAWKHSNRDTLDGLIRHYRSPRSTSPFAEPPVDGGVASLATKYPLGPGYSIQTYNICLEGLLQLRNPGESIADILEIYNEILERDLVPNGKTYSHVIRALALRHLDVGNATERWEHQKKWGRWKKEKLGMQWQEDLEAEKDLQVEGYNAEENLNSALKLFRAATMFIQGGKWFFSPYIYSILVQACAWSPNPQVDAAIEVFRHAEKLKSPGLFSCYKHLIETLGRAKDLSVLNDVWAELEGFRKAGKGSTLEEWTLPTQSDGAAGARKIERKILGLWRNLWATAIKAFAEAGDLPKAAELLAEMDASSSGALEAPSPGPDAYGNIIASAAKQGDFETAREWFDKLAAKTTNSVLRFPSKAIYSYIESLISDGQYENAVRVFEVAVEPTLEGPRGILDAVRNKLVFCTYLVRAKNVDEATAGDLLDSASNFARRARLNVDPALLSSQIDMLVRLKRYDLISHALYAFSPSLKSKVPSPELQDRLNAICVAEVSLVDLVAILGAGTAHRLHPGGAAVEAVKDRFLLASAEEKSRLTPDGWYRLLLALSDLPEEGLRDGQYDDVLLQLFEGIKDVNLQSFAASHTVTGWANVLVHRFGVERSTDMLVGPFGAAVTSLLLTPATTPALTDDSAPSPTSTLLPETPEFAPTSSPTSPTETFTIVGDISAMVDSHLSQNPPLTAQQAYSRLRHHLSRNLVPYPEAIGRLMVSLARINDEPKVVELYTLAQRILATIAEPVAQLNAWLAVEDSMLIASCHLGHLEQAGLHRARIVDSGHAPSADAYASMIANAKDTTDDVSVARELFDESQRLGVKPHLYLYNTIISKLSKARKAEMALDLFIQLKASGLRPSSVTYGAVINACCRVGDAESAAVLFDEMSAQPNFKPRVPPFNTMMQFHLQTRPSRDHVLHYYNALRAASVPPSAHTYKLLLDAYSILSPIDLPSMERVFSELRADPHVAIQGTHWASRITAYGIYGNDVNKALEVFNSIPGVPEPVAWEAILNVLGHKGSLEQLEEMRSRMDEAGAKRTAYVNNALISGYAKTGNIDKAREVFEGMGDSVTGVAAPNNHPTLLTSSGQVKPSTVTPLPTDVVYREPSTYEAMIRAELSAGSRDTAEVICSRMEERRYPVAVYLRARAILDEQDSIKIQV
ncbi:hypothetical protein P7C73_g1943, partial [Tremellales sp. Uapishka_1]